ncbi:MAG: two pore domain potassium channel family protein [Armatimonadetes bacterium]|nr:two pore domain potassium channel family protein [Armatimonadota bacterium]
MSVITILLGLTLVVLTLWDALETIVLPRSVERRIGLTKKFFQVVDPIYKAIGNRLWPHNPRAEAILGAYGPVALVALVAGWAALLIMGFAAIDMGLGVRLSESPASYWTYGYHSAETFFTLGYGDVVPVNGVGRLTSVFQAGMGFGFLALVIGYLPVLYAGFSRREAQILLLDARAGSPPTAHELLRRYGPVGPEPLTRLFAEYEEWAAGVLETTLSYPILAYYRSQHEKLTWLGAMTVMLDSTAIVLSCVRTHEEDARMLLRQSEMTFAMVRHLAVDVAYILDAKPRAVKERVTREEFELIYSDLMHDGFKLNPIEEAWPKFSEMLKEFEPFLGGMSVNLFLAIPPPVLHEASKDSWQMSAWDGGDHFRA